jgi:anti-anti-sigma factor
MDISVISNNQVKVIFSGRLDSPAVDKIETRFVATIVPAARQAIVDLSQVDFIGSLGVRMLISAARSAARNGGRMILFAPTEAVREVFEHVALADLIPIRDTEADALAALNA